MKILTKKKQRQLLMRVAANEIMARQWPSGTLENEKECKEKTSENNLELAYAIGGVQGMKEVSRVVGRFC